MLISLKFANAKAKRLPRGLDHFWSLMMDFAGREESFTASDIVALSNASSGMIYSFIARLEKASILQRNDADPRRPRYTVLQKQSATPKIRDDGTIVTGLTKQAAMWNTMRSPVGRAGFTAHDIAVWGSTDNNRIALGTARSYIKVLAAAGYLIQLAPQGRNQGATWRLAPHMNTGPLHPMALQSKMIFDQNKSEIIGDAVAEEQSL